MDLAYAIAIIGVGSFVQSSIGFGLAVIAAPLLFFIDPLYVPAPITVCAFTLSLLNAYKHRRSISFRGLKFAIVGRVPGTIIGGMLLLWIDQEQLALWLGISVLIAVGLSLKKFAIKPTNPAMFTAGFLSGFMGTSSSIGGPPMALVMLHQDSSFIRANLAAFFCVSCLMSLAMLTFVGSFGRDQIVASLPLLPATLVGYWIAMQSLHRISHQTLRYGSLALCAVAGSAAVISYFI
jgi:uncharacterized membrane protein YfcA